MKPALILLCTWLTLALGSFAQEPAKPEEKKPEKDPPAAQAPKDEKPVEKRGSVRLNGAEVKYLVQTGTFPVLKDDGAARANVFFVYYAVTDAQGQPLSAAARAARPITFCFNGGPGAAAVWLHLGGLGPKRINLPPDGLTPVTVAGTVENPNSILDATDLVFIDPVNTGLSRAVKGEKPEQFFGVDEDIEAMGEFIRLFTTRQQRWASPKYLCGESYGVVRAAGVADYLQDQHGMYFEGLVFLSGLLNFQTVSADTGNDLPYIVALPALTAAAHYHKKLAPELQANFAEAVAQARAFARGDYALALLQGRTIAAEARTKIAEQLARFTGLPVPAVEDSELRVSASYFREMLLREENKVIGRFDARVVSQDANRVRPTPEFDPSFAAVIGAYSAAVNDFIRTELGYESDHPYRVLTPLAWRYTSFANKYVSMEPRLANAMKQNPRLRLLVLTGHRDLAVPPDAVRYSLDHLAIPPALRENIVYAEYESGHMMYHFAQDAEKLRQDLVEFVRRGK